MADRWSLLILGSVGQSVLFLSGTQKIRPFTVRKTKIRPNAVHKGVYLYKKPVIAGKDTEIYVRGYLKRLLSTLHPKYTNIDNVRTNAVYGCSPISLTVIKAVCSTHIHGGVRSIVCEDYTSKMTDTNLSAVLYKAKDLQLVCLIIIFTVYILNIVKIPCITVCSIRCKFWLKHK